MTKMLFSRISPSTWYHFHVDFFAAFWLTSSSSCLRCRASLLDRSATSPTEPAPRGFLAMPPEPAVEPMPPADDPSASAMPRRAS